MWARAWELENVFWKVEFNLHQSLDLILMVCHKNRYLTCWAMSDKYPTLTFVCETLAKLVYYTSRENTLIPLDESHVSRLLATCVSVGSVTAGATQGVAPAVKETTY